MHLDVMCVGEMVIDFTPGKEPASFIRNAGGAPANVAAAVARGGLRSGFLGKVGEDDFGRFLLATLESEQVEVLCPTLETTAVTTMAFVSLTSTGERTFTFARKPGADMLLTPDEVKQADVDRSTVIHAGSCSLSKAPASTATVQALRLGHEAGKLVSFDVNYRDLMWDGDRDAAARAVAEILPYVDLLKISDEEISMFGTEADVQALAKEKGVALVVITYGARGAKAIFADTPQFVESFPVKAVDATAAGDAFWGYFITSLLTDGVTAVKDFTLERVHKALEWGNAAGGICVQTKGAIASLPTRAQLLEQLDRRGQ